ncbi:MAG: hypothetical protein ACR2IK_04445 [Chloroflexota bacterium]
MAPAPNGMPDRSVLGGGAGTIPALVSQVSWRYSMMHMAVGVGTGKCRHQAAAYDPDAERIVGQASSTVDRAGFDQFRRFLEC